MDYNQRRQLQSKQTEQKILQAALELMREQGYDGVSVRDICTKAGITTGAFYHHFPSKEAIISNGFGALDHYMERVIGGRGEEPPVERLKAILTAYATFMEEECGSLTARYYMMRLSNAQDGIRLDPTHYVEDAMVTCFRQAEADGQFSGPQPPQAAARFCFTHFRGIVIDWVLSRYAYSLRERMLEDFCVFQALLYQ